MRRSRWKTGAYRLKQYDALTVSAQVPRRVTNLSSHRPVVLHVSLAGATPEQTWVNGRFTAVDQPADATGRRVLSGSAAMTPAARFELAPSARFQDLFNADLGLAGNLWRLWSL